MPTGKILPRVSGDTATVRRLPEYAENWRPRSTAGTLVPVYG
jgi:hypothetical protein